MSDFSLVLSDSDEIDSLIDACLSVRENGGQATIVFNAFVDGVERAVSLTVQDEKDYERTETPLI